MSKKNVIKTEKDFFSFFFFLFFFAVVVVVSFCQCLWGLYEVFDTVRGVEGYMIALSNISRGSVRDLCPNGRGVVVPEQIKTKCCSLRGDLKVLWMFWWVKDCYVVGIMSIIYNIWLVVVVYAL